MTPCSAVDATVTNHTGRLISLSCGVTQGCIVAGRAAAWPIIAPLPMLITEPTPSPATDYGTQCMLQ